MDNKQIKYNFKVGDKVISSCGEVGKIVLICDCEYCQERGFLEPCVKNDITGWTNYITDLDLANNFSNYYSIGDYVFGNLTPVSNIQDQLREAKKEVESAKKEVEALEVQIETVKELTKVEEAKILGKNEAKT